MFKVGDLAVIKKGIRWFKPGTYKIIDICDCNVRAECRVKCPGKVFLDGYPGPRCFGYGGKYILHKDLFSKYRERLCLE